MDKKILKPRIRFKGFTDDWEQCEVSKKYKVTRGYVLSTNLLKNEKNQEYKYPVYSSQTTNEGLLGYYNEYLYSDSITWTTDGANAGTVKYRKGPFYCTNVCGVLISFEGFSNKANAEFLNKIAWKFVSKVGNPKLMNNVMSNIYLKYSSNLLEQEKISTLFDKIDSIITLHQRKYF